MKTIRQSFSFAATLVALTALVGCGGAGSESTADQNAAAAGESTVTGASQSELPSSPVAESAIQAVELVSRDDTADEAMETYLEGIKQGKLDIALTVLHPDSPGANALTKMMVGWEKAKADGAPVEMAIALIAGEVDALTYEKISDDGSFATFRFMIPTREEPWEIEVIKTPEGWRIKPPDSGLPTG